jgi:hypothetical protein
MSLSFDSINDAHEASLSDGWNKFAVRASTVNLTNSELVRLRNHARSVGRPHVGWLGFLYEFVASRCLRSRTTT